MRRTKKRSDPQLTGQMPRHLRIYELGPLASVAAKFSSYGKCWLRRNAPHTRCLLSHSANVAALQRARPHRDGRVTGMEQMTDRTICGQNRSESPERLLTHQNGPTTPHGCTFGRPFDLRTSPRGARAALKRAHGNAPPGRPRRR